MLLLFNADDALQSLTIKEPFVNAIFSISVQLYTDGFFSLVFVACRLTFYRHLM